MRALLWPEAPLVVQHTTADLLADAQASGVTVVLGPGVRVAYPNPQASPVSGYFVDRPTPTLGVATGEPWTEAFPVLLHEHAHLTQWREQAAVWTDLFREGIEANDWMDRWLAGEELPADQVTWAFRAIRAVEMDCERRALAQIEARGLPVNPKVYAQKANAYVLFYLYAQRTRSWPTHPKVYDEPGIWRQAPITLGDPEVLPPALAAAYAAHFP